MAQNPTQLATGRFDLKRYDPPAVAYRQHAVKMPQKKSIHPRRIIPSVQPGPHRPDPRPSSELRLDPRPTPLAEAPQPHASLAVDPNKLVLVRNVELGSTADNDTASHVGEPSVASNGDIVFYTGNWYAAVSSDGGATFKYVDPFNSFPNPEGMEFCCDQVVQYIPSIDTFVWLMQYSEKPAGGNVQRLAFAKTAEVVQGRWRLYDIHSEDLGIPNAFLDFPDLALGQKYLYVTTNVFSGNQWTASAIVRLPFAGIMSDTITAEHAVSRENFSFRVAQNTGDRAFWASHQSTSELRVFSWDEGATQVNIQDVPVASWSADDYTSPTPGGSDWLGRADPRLTGATWKGDELWFAWGAGRGGANNRPHPYVQVARLRASDLQLLENINIWDQKSAVCYGALTSDADGSDVATSYAVGGGPINPSHVVGFLTALQANIFTAQGQRGPNDNKWGDYLTVRRHQPDGKVFVATGYTLQETHSPSSSDAMPRFIQFGRAKNVGPVLGGAGPVVA